MGKKRLLLIAAALVVILCLGIAVWALLDADDPEPSYQGKPLSYWLQGFDPSVNSGSASTGAERAISREEAEAAVKAIGTNAVPFLLRLLKHQDSKVKESIETFFKKIHLIKTPNGRIRITPNSLGMHGLTTLGPLASNAVPQLIALIERDKSPYPQTAAPVILGQIGPAAAPAIPTLLKSATHTNEIVRYNTIWALGRIHTQPELVVPALIGFLSDTNAHIRRQAADALGEFGKDARAAVPVLTAILAYYTPSIPPATQFNGRLVTLVGPKWRSFTTSLGNPNVFEGMREALRKIDPETAARFKSNQFIVPNSPNDPPSNVKSLAEP